MIINEHDRFFCWRSRSAPKELAPTFKIPSTALIPGVHRHRSRPGGPRPAVTPIRCQAFQPPVESLCGPKANRLGFLHSAPFVSDLSPEPHSKCARWRPPDRPGSAHHPSARQRSSTCSPLANAGDDEDRAPIGDHSRRLGMRRAIVAPRPHQAGCRGRGQRGWRDGGWGAAAPPNGVNFTWGERLTVQLSIRRRFVGSPDR